MLKRRAVITGIGIVSPLGNDRETTFSGLLDGANGIGMITSFDTSAFSTKIAGEVRNFDPEVRRTEGGAASRPIHALDRRRGS